MLFTTTMVEVLSWVKTSMEVIPTWSKVFRNVFAELILSSAAELLSMSKNCWFSAKFLKAHCDSCVLSRTKKFFLKMFVYVWRSKNILWVLAKRQLFLISCRFQGFWFLCQNGFIWTDIVWFQCFKWISWSLAFIWAHKFEGRKWNEGSRAQNWIKIGQKW